MDDDSSFPLLIGLIYVFNLLFGTGLLTMPAVFQQTGYLIGSICIAFLCWISYVQTTFLIESMANANFVKRIHCPGRNRSFTRSQLSRLSNCQKQTSKQNIEDFRENFVIIDKFEMGSMSKMFLEGWMSKCFFLSIIAYLFGDVIIYNVMMAKSLRELACTSNDYCKHTGKDYLDTICWDNLSITRRVAYRLFLLCFAAVLIPLTYFKIQKTKDIQVLTIILRWAAGLSMIGITIYLFVSNQADGNPKAMNFKNLPRLFGICIYSFMCHHSIPSMITPIQNKTKLYSGLTWTYVLVLAFYLIIALTAVFAFRKLEQIYTLNFKIDRCAAMNISNPADIVGFNVFLPAYPIFTLFSSYTIISLTLNNNMKVLIEFTDEWPYTDWIQYSLPLISLLPALAISLMTENVSAIVGIVGAYTGTLIQYVFPSLLVFYSRKMVRDRHIAQFEQERLSPTDSASTTAVSPATSMTNITDDPKFKSNIQSCYYSLNPFCSPYQHDYWIYLTGVWWILCLFFVTYVRYIG